MVYLTLLPQRFHSVKCCRGEEQNGGKTSSKSTSLPPSVVILPGLGNNTNDYKALAATLDGRGFPVTVPKVSRLDWLRNAAGLLDGNYWRGTLKPRPVLDWYFDRMNAAVAHAKTQGKRVAFIGHSAGGWLARVYMLEYGHEDICLLITLGTPHLPPPKGVPGVFDQTRGLLDYVQENSPGAFHSPHVKYVCVASRYIKGAGRGESSDGVAATGVGTVKTGTLVETLVGTDSESEEEEETAPTYNEKFIGQGYKQVCGRADVWGDGVVPAISAHLDGAVNVTLEGVYHSPLGADDDERPWYGSPVVLQEWISYLH